MFGRRKLYTTVDMNRCFAIRNALSDAGIACFVRTKTMMNSGTMRGMPVINAPASREYRVYVRRKDFDKARSVQIN